MDTTLTIENIDLDLLDEQREIVSNAIEEMKDSYDLTHLTSKEMKALRGIVNVLSKWSDEYSIRKKAYLSKDSIS